jgi:ABC-2 type transport system permease protein
MRSTLRAIWAIAWKDISVWLRQPPVIATTVMPALGFMIIIVISAAAVGRNPIALVVLDDSPSASQFAGVVEQSDAFVARRAAPQEADRLLSQLAVAAVVTIPADFGAKLAAHQPDPVSIEINNLNLDFTNDLRRSLPAAIDRYYAQQAGNPVNVAVAETDLRTQDVNLIQFEIVPNLILLLTMAGIINCGLATAREFEDLTIKELLLAPIAGSTVIAGKLLAGWLTTLLLSLIVLVVGALTGELRPAGAFWLLAVGVIALFGLASAGLGAALGAQLRRYTAVTGIGINISIYLFFLSGGIGVAAFLPAWVQNIARFTPTYYAVHALQMAVFYQSTDQIGRDLAVLVLTAALGLGLGVIALRRRVIA